MLVFVQDCRRIHPAFLCREIVCYVLGEDAPAQELPGPVVGFEHQNERGAVEVAMDLQPRRLLGPRLACHLIRDNPSRLEQLSKFWRSSWTSPESDVAEIKQLYISTPFTETMADGDDKPALLSKKLHHFRKLLRRAAKKARTFETAKAVKRIKSLKAETNGDAGARTKAIEAAEKDMKGIKVIV